MQGRTVTGVLSAQGPGEGGLECHGAGLLACAVGTGLGFLTGNNLSCLFQKSLCLRDN